MKLKVVKTGSYYYVLVGVKKWFKTKWYHLLWKHDNHKVMFRTKTQAMCWAVDHQRFKLTDLNLILGEKVSENKYFDEICR